MSIEHFLFVTSCVNLLLTFALSDDSIVAPGLPEDNMKVDEIIKYYGYPVENHDVTTEDGYILTMQRIPYGLKDQITPRPVAFLQHGLTDSSLAWVANLPHQSLAYILADHGFDVWLGNSRGNSYGKRHTKYSTSAKEFWDFTWDDMAKYDLLASFKHILSVTKALKLGYVGHSQGSQIAFAGFSNIPDLNSLVSAFVALGPCVYIGNSAFVIPKSANASEIAKSFANLTPNGEHPKEVTNFPEFASPNRNQTRISILKGHNPEGTSTKNILHFIQSYLSEEFQKYDYGTDGNNEHYGQPTPPRWKLNPYPIPVAMFYGGKDVLTIQIDVERAISDLGDNVKLKKLLPSYDHIDFIWGLDANENIYPDIINFLKQYQK